MADSTAQLHGALQRHFIAALQRRAAGHSAAVQQLLDDRLARTLAGLQPRQAQAVPDAAPTIDTTPDTSGAPGPLAQLLQHIAQASAAPGGELQAVQQFGNSWARLRVDQQLTRSVARQPENAGPLNSQRLMLQTLQQLRTLSPAYLQRFMAHADALLWLETAGAASVAPLPAARGDGKRPGKGGRRSG